MSYKLFLKTWEQHIERLSLYIPIVVRVHGQSHPEFYKVCSLFEEISKKVKKHSNDLDLVREFNELRVSTNNFEVPDGVCETYEAVYTMLEELDKAYFD